MRSVAAGLAVCLAAASLGAQSRTITLDSYPSAVLGTSRTIKLLLPDPLPEGLLPVLVVNDGQEAGGLRFAATLDREWEAGSLAPFAVVLVSATGDRLREYGVPGVPDYQNRGDRADLYAAFLKTELLPDLEARYPLDPSNRTVLGFSLGGLSAFSLAWSDPELFRNAGVMSGSFWWRDRDGGREVAQASRIVLWWAKTKPVPPGARYWFQAGTRDETSDRNNNGVIDAIEDTLDLMQVLRDLGVAEGNLSWTLVKNGYHEPATWARVLPDFLRWAFPPNSFRP